MNKSQIEYLAVEDLVPYANNSRTHDDAQIAQIAASIKEFGSYPDDYQAKTDNIGKYMIGMSVPPKMTEQVAKAVCEQWLGIEYGANP